MAKTTKKATAGMSSIGPVFTKKTTTGGSKNSGAGLVSIASGGSKTAKAKAEYEKAKKGGAAKTAAKLTKPVKVGSEPAYYFLQDGTRTPSRARKNIYESSGAGSKKVVKQNILNDKSKTATRAKIVEMNAKKKASKPKSTGPSTASKVKDFFKEKPKYTSEQIVENKKLQAQIDAAAKKKKK